MKSIYLFLICTFLLSCSNQQQTIETKNSDTSAKVQVPGNDQVIAEADTGEVTEYMDMEIIRINNKFPLTTGIENIEMLAGKPDSTVQLDPEEDACGCNEGYSAIVYYGSSMFQYASHNSKGWLTLLIVDLTKNNDFFLQYGDLRLDRNTTFAEIEKRFPKSSKDIRGTTTETTKSIAIPVSKEPVDVSWILTFENGKLTEVDYWFNCC